jgi:hypothetical protein
MLEKQARKTVSLRIETDQARLTCDEQSLAEAGLLSFHNLAKPVGQAARLYLFAAAKR